MTEDFVKSFKLRVAMASAEQAGRLLNDGVLNIRDIVPQGLFKHRTVHGSNLKQAKEALECCACFLRRQGLAE